MTECLNMFGVHLLVCMRMSDMSTYLSMFVSMFMSMSEGVLFV